MRRASKKGGFTIRTLNASEHGFEYQTFQLVGYLHGERIRKRFKKREDAVFEKARLEVLAANAGEIQPVNTRLTPDQVADAEAAFRRLGGGSLVEAIDWYLANYRPPAVPKSLAEAKASYLGYKRPHVEPVHLADVERKISLLCAWFPGAQVHDVGSDTLEAKMAERHWAPKTWNNVRACFLDFFKFAMADPRRWRTDNPAAQILPRKVARGLPKIERARVLADLFAFLESYSGGPRRPKPPGFLVPYFALATFAGLRPSVPDGEIWKIGELKDLSRVIDSEVGVIRISPEVAKTDYVRTVKIREPLAAFLAAYPLGEYPIIVSSLQHHVTEVRKRFALTDDVLRHTWISAHVARFKSIGEAALEAGNSEPIIRAHYLDSMSDAEAAAFWSLRPQRQSAASA